MGRRSHKTDKSILKKFWALETLHVDIREPYYSSDIFLAFWSGDGFSNVLALQYLPLKMVTVVVMGRLNEYRWPKVHAGYG
jgi:hypothetical protein